MHVWRVWAGGAGGRAAAHARTQVSRTPPARALCTPGRGAGYTSHRSQPHTARRSEWGARGAGGRRGAHTVPHTVPHTLNA